MKAFLAVVGKHDVIDPDVLQLVRTLASAALPFRHMLYRSDEWQAGHGRTAVFAWDNDLETLPGVPLISLHDGIATTMTGYVSHPSLGHAWDIGGLERSKLLCDDAVSDLGGIFVLVRAGEDDERVHVWKSASNAVPLYWAEGPDYYAISSRALLLSFLLAKATRPEYDAGSLVGFLSIGRYMNRRTPFRGVHVVGPNSHVIVSPTGVNVSPIDDFELGAGTAEPTPEDYDAIAGLLVAGAQPFKHRRVVCSLTGGKDSRLVAAALHAAGVDFTAQTSGFPENPDVIVARKVAAALAISHHNSASPGTMAQEASAIVVNPLDRARRVLFGADGLLSAYENLVPPERFSPSPVLAGGQGGEVALRDTLGAGLVSWEQVMPVLHQEYMYSPQFFLPSALDRYDDFINTWIARCRPTTSSPNALIDRFDFNFDSGVSGIGRTVAEIGRYGLYPLQDNRVMKAGIQVVPRVKLNEEMLFNLLHRLAPQLVDVPFAFSRWTFEKDGPRRGDEEGWARRAPVTASSGTKGAFNWRHNWSVDMWDIFYEQIFRDARSEALFEVLDRQALHSWFLRRRGAVIPNGSVFAWAVFSASVLLSNEWLSEPALDGPIVRIAAPATV